MGLYDSYKQTVSETLTAKEALKIANSLPERTVNLYVNEALTSVREAARDGLTETQVLLPPGHSELCIKELEKLGYKAEVTGNGAKLSWANS